MCGYAGNRSRVTAITIPVAHLGDGTLIAFEDAGFDFVRMTVDGPTGEAVTTRYATRGAVAVVELADACGLGRLPHGQLEPLEASSLGVGQVLAAALSASYRDVVLAVGGSASSDGGAGMMTALGAVLRDRHGRVLPLGGGALADLGSLDLSGLHPALAGARVVLASDVDNPLLCIHGEVAVYGSQKGAVGAPIGPHHPKVAGAKAPHPKKMSAFLSLHRSVDRGRTIRGVPPRKRRLLTR